MSWRVSLHNYTTDCVWYAACGSRSLILLIGLLGISNPGGDSGVLLATSCDVLRTVCGHGREGLCRCILRNTTKRVTLIPCWRNVAQRHIDGRRTLILHRVNVPICLLAAS